MSKLFQKKTELEKVEKSKRRRREVFDLCQEAFKKSCKDLKFYFFKKKIIIYRNDKSI